MGFVLKSKMQTLKRSKGMTLKHFGVRTSQIAFYMSLNNWLLAGSFLGKHVTGDHGISQNMGNSFASEQVTSCNAVTNDFIFTGQLDRTILLGLSLLARPKAHVLAIRSAAHSEHSKMRLVTILPLIFIVTLIE